MNYLLGIDLGTTYCTVTAIDEDGKTTVIRNRNGEFKTPSVVYFDKNKKNNFVIGKNAKELYLSDTEDRIVSLVKREMGSDKDKVRLDYSTKQYRPFSYWNKIFSPEEISSKILRQLKEDAEKQLGTKITQAVITHPAYFKQVPRQATKTAGELAGLEVLDLISEPTATAKYYATISKKIEEKGKERVFIFDLGGGTFDVTIMNITKDKNGISVSEEYKNGDARLGGADWDNIFRGYIVSKFNDTFNFDFDFGEEGLEKEKTNGQLMLDVEKLKIKLSEKNIESSIIKMEYKGYIYEETITKEKYASITKIMTDKCKNTCNEFLQEAKIQWDDIDTVLMVGSMSNCPFIQDMLRELCGKDIVFGEIDPKICVSQGAAIHAHKKYCEKLNKKSVVLIPNELIPYDTVDGNVNSIDELVKKEEKATRKSELINFDTNILPSSISILVDLHGQKYCHKIFQKNNAYPDFFEDNFNMTHENQKEVLIALYEGESTNPTENIKLGDVTLIQEGNHNSEDFIHVRVEIDSSGIIHVLALDDKTKKYVTQIIKYTDLLSQEEKNKIIKESKNDKFTLGNTYE